MTDRPNVLVVLTDQQRWDTLGCQGNPHDLTPNLDGAAAEGTLFERAFTPQPVCGPARACLQSGQFATETGVWSNGGALTDCGHALARQFASAGYDTGYVGKWHLADRHPDPVPEEERLGYDYWRVSDVLEATSQPYEGFVYDGDGERVPLDGYRVDALTDLTVEFLERDRDAPFFCFLSHLEPHHQNDVEQYVAPAGYDREYRNPWVPPDLRGRHGDWYESLPDYYGICRRVDETYGRLLDALERRGELEDTVVVFASDHGSHFRTRNGEYKRSPHEASVRVPLVVRGPGFEDGGRVEDLVSLLDLPPTLCDAAGVGVPDAYRGRSLVELVRGEVEEWRDEVFVQVSEAECGRAIRTDRWKFAVYDPETGGREAPASDRYVDRYLYDLDADPAERENLVGRPDHADVADRLRERLGDRIAAVEGERPELVPATHHQS